MEILFTKEGCRAGPYVAVKVEEGSFVARIDTGADVTVIPERFLGGFKVSKRVSVKSHNGSRETVWAYKGWVTVVGKTIYLDKVLVRSDNLGLIGMDVLEHFTMFFEPGKVTMEPIDWGEVKQ